MPSVPATLICPVARSMKTLKAGSRLDLLLREDVCVWKTDVETKELDIQPLGSPRN